MFEIEYTPAVFHHSTPSSISDIRKFYSKKNRGRSKMNGKEWGRGREEKRDGVGKEIRRGIQEGTVDIEGRVEERGGKMACEAARKG